MDKGQVLRIERISPHDGQGLRTVIYLKGCPLGCKWCSTPESQSLSPELNYKQAKCWHCGKCIETCPKGALKFSEDDSRILRDKGKCNNCFHCVKACRPEAIGVYGKSMGVEEIMKEIRKDTLFYFYSKGGVTLSGGDILMQADFSREIIKACREECIHTVAELDMYGNYENVYKVLEFLNAYYVDIKLMDSREHKRWTGVGNASILENTQRAAIDFPDKPLHIRVPLIPKVNDSRENIDETVEFCKGLASCQSLEFLPFHHLGDAAYGYLDRPYAFADYKSMTFEAAYGKIKHLITPDLLFEVKISNTKI